MKTKNTMISRSYFGPFADSLNGIPAPDNAYVFGVEVKKISGTVTVTIEQTLNGGLTFSNVVTFTLDTVGSIETREVYFTGEYLRVTVSSVNSTDFNEFTVWSK